MNGHNAMTDYSQQLEAFKESDARRDALMNEIYKKYQDLQLKYAEKCDDYSNEVESRRMWQGKATGKSEPE